MASRNYTFAILVCVEYVELFRGKVNDSCYICCKYFQVLKLF